MNDIAIVFNDSVLYMHSIIMILAVTAAVLCAAGLRMLQRPKGLNSFLATAAAAIPVSLIMSRLVYGFFALESMSLIPGIMFSGNGGNSLPGAFLGVLITVLISKKIGLTDSASELLDCIAPAAALGICIGRLSALFSNDDRGFDIPVSEAQNYIVCTDPQSGQPFLAVFAYESIFAGLLFAVLLCVFLLRYKSKNPPSGILAGDTALFFFLGFGGSQGVLESMRTDSLTIIGLGFVRVFQIIALFCLLIPLIVFSVRAIKRCGFRKSFLLYWFGAAAALAAAVYMEFTLSADFEVQKNNYSVMAGGLIILQEAALCLYASSACTASKHTELADQHALATPYPRSQSPENTLPHYPASLWDD